MVRRTPAAGETRVYDISGRKVASLQAALSVGSQSATAVRRARRKLELQDTETDLIHEFAFPTVCNRIKVSSDGQYIFASGTYPPQIHVYDTEQLSQKFKRHVNTDIVEFQILESDWRKFVLLTADRYVDLHSPFGSHFKTRVPRFGRDLMLHRGSCDLFVCGDGRQVWRLNLEQGRFLAPLDTVSGNDGGNNVCGISPVNSLLAFGGDTGLLDIWDSRSVGQAKSPVATFDVVDAIRSHSPSSLLVSDERPQITAIRMDDTDGVTMAVGLSDGHTAMLDLRSSKPLFVRDQGNGLPIRSIRFHDDRKHCITADPKSIKVWQRHTGVNLMAVEPDSDINHACLIGGSGVICAALEAPRVKSYYVPALGPAPKWCAFLDNFTEELENGRQVRSGASRNANDDNAGLEEVYENYKFVPHDELEGLGLGHLIGTNLLKPYMHGYFVHMKLYRRAVDVAEPFAYEKYRKEKAREKLESQRGSRITKSKSKTPKKVKVNQIVVDALREKERTGKKGARTGATLLEDERFTAMFSNKDFAVEESAERFQHLHPDGLDRKRDEEEDNSDREYLEQFELVDEEGEKGGKSQGLERIWSSDEDDDDESGDSGVEDDANDGSNIRKSSMPASTFKSGKKKQSQEESSANKNSKNVRMYEISDASEAIGLNGNAFSRKQGGSIERGIRDNVTLGARITGSESQKDSVERKKLENNLKLRRSQRAKRS